MFGAKGDKGMTKECTGHNNLKQTVAKGMLWAKR